MKKLIFILCAAAAGSVALILFAFYFIDFNLHKSYAYDIFLNDRPLGVVNVDRYVTEDKVVYKGRTELPDSLSYTASTEKLFLNKSNLGLVRFIQESSCGRGISRVILLVQDNEFSDYLYLEYPKFFSMKGFETGEKTMIYSPYDLMTYMPVIERYNFWKKGTQYFEVITPADYAIPPMRDKLEVRELGDVYVQALGRKVEAEYFAIKSKGLPETKITLAKYTHTLLALEVGNRGMRFVIKSYAEDPARKIIFILKDAAGKLRQNLVMRDMPSLEQKSGQKRDVPDTLSVTQKKEASEVIPERYRESFFDGGGTLLSARMWIPEGPGPFPAVLFVQKDGPSTKGEDLLIKAYGEALSSAGYAMMAFDGPGQGKSQGNIFSSDDDTRIKNITGAVAALQSDPLLEKDTITLIGHEGGAYAALEAAKDLSAVSRCVALSPDIAPLRAGSSAKMLKDRMLCVLEAQGLGSFDQSYMGLAAGKLAEHLSAVSGSTDGVGYFIGVKTPMAAYRKYLSRKPLQAAIGLDKPVLLIVGKNDLDPAGSEALEALRLTAAGKESTIKVSVFKDLGPYIEKKYGPGPAGSGFTADPDVISAVNEWLRDSRRISAASTSDKAAPYTEIRASSGSK